MPNVSPQITPDGDDDSDHGGPYGKDSNQLGRHARFLGSRESPCPSVEAPATSGSAAARS
ncbi:MAG: hypothetical protein OXO54_08100 [Chloroflexota bacterium]|nr:hypothetical protein [Chloroflexota bacterium]MDE2898271.1 hypothetical protein [Chloroflexota bacterium]